MYLWIQQNYYNKVLNYIYARYIDICNLKMFDNHDFLDANHVDFKIPTNIFAFIFSVCKNAWIRFHKNTMKAITTWVNTFLSSFVLWLSSWRNGHSGLTVRLNNRRRPRVGQHYGNTIALPWNADQDRERMSNVYRHSPAGQWCHGTTVRTLGKVNCDSKD